MAAVTRETPHAVDTAIIGAGVAGLYAAFRLATARRSPETARTGTPSVAVFEATDRAGGRLCTARQSDKDPVVDLGAMRFLRSQELITALAEHVLRTDAGARIVPFAQTAPESTLLHLRGHTFSKAAASDGARSPQLALYGLPEAWRGMTPMDVLFAIVQQVLQADDTSIQQVVSAGPRVHEVCGKLRRTLRYRFDGPFKDRLLLDMNTSQLVLDRCGMPTLQYLIDGIGYDQMNLMHAAEVIEVHVKIAATQGQTFTLEGGMEVLASGLQERAKAAGANVYTRARLLSFERSDDAEYKYALTFADDFSGATLSVLANNVVLALPRLALERLHSSFIAIGGVQRANEVLSHTRSVGCVPAVKVAMWFKDAWWAAAYGANASVVTDLPLRQCYLFGGAEAGAQSVVTAVYCTMQSVHFWKGLQDSSRRGDADRREFVEDAAPALVREAMRQLRAVFGSLADGVEPVRSVYKVWDGARDADTMGIHCALPGREAQAIAKQMEQPVEQERVFVCGEAYSDRHGWVEGALSTTEKVLQKDFALDPPDWFPRRIADDANDESLKL